jgi:hypothetical protein
MFVVPSGDAVLSKWNSHLVSTQKRDETAKQLD